MTELENGSNGRFAFFQVILAKAGIQSIFDIIWILAFTDMSEATDESSDSFPGFCRIWRFLPLMQVETTFFWHLVYRERGRRQSHSYPGRNPLS